RAGRAAAVVAEVDAARDPADDQRELHRADEIPDDCADGERPPHVLLLALRRIGISRCARGQLLAAVALMRSSLRLPAEPHLLSQAERSNYGKESAAVVVRTRGIEV